MNSSEPIEPRAARNVAAWLKHRQRPLLVSHRKPDGDALGSLAALAQVLIRWELQPTVALFDAFPPRYAVLQDAAAWQPWDAGLEKWSQFDAVAIVDTSSHAQLQPLVAKLPSAPPLLVIDHHATSDHLTDREGDLALCDATASATCLILAEWLQAIDEPLDQSLAEALYAGIATDTGWFRFSNADARTYRAAAKLVAAGVDVAGMNRALYDTDPEPRIRLRGRVLETMQVRAGGELVVLQLRLSDFKQLGADHSMTEDLVNAPGSLAGLEVTVMFTEQADGPVRVNFRSKERVDVAAIAATFGGGGHVRAAGASVEGDWETATAKVIAVVEAALAE